MSEASVTEALFHSAISCAARGESVRAARESCMRQLVQLGRSEEDAHRQCIRVLAKAVAHITKESE